MTTETASETEKIPIARPAALPLVAVVGQPNRRGSPEDDARDAGVELRAADRS